MRLVIVESPFANACPDYHAGNITYARAAVRDAIERGESPIASHLLLTQPGILNDDNPEERQTGMEAGWAWRRVADAAVFYVDRGWSGGMLAARQIYEDEGFPFEVREIQKEDTE